MHSSWSLVERAFTIETIMTPRTQWLYWDGKESLELLWGRIASERIDTVPVIENDQVIGLLRQGQDGIIPLTEDWLIKHDTPISQALQRFALGTESILLVRHSQGIDIGIVTPADFNKPPARTLIFTLLSELEMLIASFIGDYFRGRQQEILKSIDPLNKIKIEEAIAKMEQEDIEIEIIHLLYLSDMVNIIGAESKLRKRINVSELTSKKKTEKTLNGLVHLRNDVAHPINLMVGKDRNIQKLDEQLHRVVSLLDQMHS
ncbi:MAG: hypothetical protein H6672_08735 [Anaerolineaceae bacterium]|nr:hypothetical protein [Anaerolineaceae bacterium]